MCGDSPPPAYKGPGDAHSNQEWIWQRERYLDLFDDAPEGTLRGESTPFYLYNRDARRRIAADRPGRQADRGAAGPGRPRVLQLDAPVDGRARAARRHRRGGRARAEARSTTAGRRSGTTQRLGHVRPAAAGPLRPLPARAGAAAALPRAGRRARTRRCDRVCRLPRVSRASRSTTDPVGQLAARSCSDGVRAAHRRPGDPRRRHGGAVPAAAGLARGQQAADQPAAQGWRPVRGRSSRRSSARLLLEPHLRGHRAARGGHRGVVRGRGGPTATGRRLVREPGGATGRGQARAERR